MEAPSAGVFGIYGGASIATFPLDGVLLLNRLYRTKGAFPISL